MKTGGGDNADNDQLLPFPIPSELNGRVRRLISSYQREFKREEMRKLAEDKRIERRERIEQVIREREQQKIDLEQRKWSKKETAYFLKTLMSFGVEYNRREKRYIWDRFRTIAKLDKKYDDTLSEYLMAVVALCKKVVGRKIDDAEEMLIAGSGLESISEERANLVLERIETMNKLRDKTIFHPSLEDRLQLADTALGLPDWWVPGKHDRDLLVGATKHGISRMEYYILNDPDLCFRDILKKHLLGESLVDKKAMDEFLKRKKTWLPEEEPAAASEEVKEEVKKEEKETPASEDGEKKDKKKSDRRRSSDKAAKADESSKEKTKSEEKEKEKDESTPKKESRSRKSRDKRTDDEEEEDSPKVEEVREARSRRKSTKDSSDATRLAIEASRMAKADKEKKDKKKEKEREEKEKERERKRSEEKKQPKEDEEEDESKEKESKKDEEDEGKKADAPEESNGAEKAEEKKEKKEKADPDASSTTPVTSKRCRVNPYIQPPQISMQQMEQMAKGGMLYDLEVMNELMAQTYAAAIKWPKDKVLEIRLLHIIACVEYGVWPVPGDYDLSDHLEAEEKQDSKQASAANEVSPAETPQRDTATPMSEASDASADAEGGRRKRSRKPDTADQQNAGDKTSKIRSLLQQGQDGPADDAR